MLALTKQTTSISFTRQAVRLAFAAVLACGGMLLATSAAMATEVDRNGPFINKQCGKERHGCTWCTDNGCYAVTKCTETKCTITRGPPLPSVVARGHNGTTPPAASSTRKLGH
jgi:hypothetical protein